MIESLERQWILYFNVFQKISERVKRYVIFQSPGSGYLIFCHCSCFQRKLSLHCQILGEKWGKSEKVCENDNKSYWEGLGPGILCCTVAEFALGHTLSSSYKIRRNYKVKVKVAQSSPTLRPHGLYSPSQNTGVGSLSLLQGILPTQESNWGLPQCRPILYQLSHKGRNCMGLKITVHVQLAQILDQKIQIRQKTNCRFWRAGAKTGWWEQKQGTSHTRCIQHHNQERTPFKPPCRPDPWTHSYPHPIHGISSHPHTPSPRTHLREWAREPVTRFHSLLQPAQEYQKSLA